MAACILTAICSVAILVHDCNNFIFASLSLSLSPVSVSPTLKVHVLHSWIMSFLCMLMKQM